MPKTKKKQESVTERVWKIAVVVLILLLLVGSAITVIVTAWGGCQPLAIPAAYRADTEMEIVFPAKLLTYSDTMFQAWDGGDFSSTLENYAA